MVAVNLKAAMAALNATTTNQNDDFDGRQLGTSTSRRVSVGVAYKQQITRHEKLIQSQRETGE